MKGHIMAKTQAERAKEYRARKRDESVTIEKRDAPTVTVTPGTKWEPNGDGSVTVSGRPKTGPGSQPLPGDADYVGCCYQDEAGNWQVRKGTAKPAKWDVERWREGKYSLAQTYAHLHTTQQEALQA